MTSDKLPAPSFGDKLTLANGADAYVLKLMYANPASGRYSLMWCMDLSGGYFGYCTAVQTCMQGEFVELPSEV